MPPAAKQIVTGLNLPQTKRDGALKLPPFPARNSPEEVAELKLLHQLEAQRTPEGDAWAKGLDAHGGIPIWNDAVDAYADRNGALKGAAAKVLVGGAMAVTGALTGIAMLRRNRERPYLVDPTLQTVVPKQGAPSNPSGHTSASYAAATVLAAIDPSNASSIRGKAEEMAASRLYGGVHFPSDVRAGALLGTAVARWMLKLVPGA
jgi:acid phosphatase (class A)